MSRNSNVDMIMQMTGLRLIGSLHLGFCNLSVIMSLRGVLSNFILYTHIGGKPHDDFVSRNLESD